MRATGSRARFAAVSCPHVPYHDRAAISLLCDHVGEWDLTDFVMLGDVFESSAVSLHPDSDAHDHTLLDEYEQAAELLEQIRAALPAECGLHWLLGNHDDNIQTNDNRRTDPRIRKMLHWNYSPFADVFGRWKQYPYRKPSIHDQAGMMRLGQVCFVHGYQTGLTSDNSEAKRMRYAVGGTPNLLIVRGHTHRPQPVTQCRDGGRPTHCWYANAGTMGPVNPPPLFMQRKDTSEWGCAVVVGTADLGRVRRMTRPQWSVATIPISGLRGRRVVLEAVDARWELL